MKYTITTLGCKVNQYESQAMEQWLTQRGHTEVGPGEDFDLGIVNTCTVTAVADKKNRNVIRRLRKQCPRAVLAVCGCYAQVKPEDIRSARVSRARLRKASRPPEPEITSTPSACTSSGFS